MPLTNRNKNTQNITLEYDFVATTPQTRLSTINTSSNINDNKKKHRRNDSSNISFIFKSSYEYIVLLMRDLLKIFIAIEK